jgi:hypothetical protein
MSTSGKRVMLVSITFNPECWDIEVPARSKSFWFGKMFEVKKLERHYYPEVACGHELLRDVLKIMGA